MLKVKLLEGAKMPTKAHPGDAGWDLYAYETPRFARGEVFIVSTGCKFEIPEGYYGRVADRSSMALKGFHVVGGVVDCTYRGIVKIMLIYFGNRTVEINEGDKIAQLIITKIHEGGIEEVKKVDKTERGDEGFGSSGK